MLEHNKREVPMDKVFVVHVKRRGQESEIYSICSTEEKAKDTTSRLGKYLSGGFGYYSDIWITEKEVE
jgi:hypothetical protein